MTKVSRRLNALYMVGKYAICNATTTNPKADAKKYTIEGPVRAISAIPSVNTDDPLSRKASASPSPTSGHSTRPNPTTNKPSHTPSSAMRLVGAEPARIRSFVS
ncbi:MAG: hypothetical protein M3290_06410 [Actinomycetota bacterium]|nr:hypothetical protein [Actinomycetota bacterium]